MWTVGGVSLPYTAAHLARARRRNTQPLPYSLDLPTLLNVMLLLLLFFIAASPAHALAKPGPSLPCPALPGAFRYRRLTCLPPSSCSCLLLQLLLLWVLGC